MGKEMGEVESLEALGVVAHGPATLTFSRNMLQSVFSGLFQTD